MLLCRGNVAWFNFHGRFVAKRANVFTISTVASARVSRNISCFNLSATLHLATHPVVPIEGNSTSVEVLPTLMHGVKFASQLFLADAMQQAHRRTIHNIACTSNHMSTILASVCYTTLHMIPVRDHIDRGIPSRVLVRIKSSTKFEVA